MKHVRVVTGELVPNLVLVVDGQRMEVPPHVRLVDVGRTRVFDGERFAEGPLVVRMVPARRR